MKSACYFCPFNALKADAIERHKAHPEQVADALMLDNTTTSERNLPLYRDALSKVPRLVYVRNLNGWEYICPDLGEVDRSSGERCCKGSTDWLKHPTGTCLCDAFSNSNW
jgi:hypothetical protein